jgi:hypothetical protein
MGLFAVAHLAERQGVRVRLRPGSPRGLTALVWLPESVTETGTRPYGRRSQPLAVHAGFRDSDRQARETVQAAGAATSHWFRSRRPSAAGAAGDDRPAEADPRAGDGGLAGTDPWADGRHAAQVIANPVRGDQTAAGLPVRVPKANLIPGSAGGGRRAGSGAASRPPDSDEAQAPRRSADLARSRLGGIQRGIRRAKDSTPRAEEGADR